MRAVFISGRARRKPCPTRAQFYRGNELVGAIRFVVLNETGTVHVRARAVPACCTEIEHEQLGGHHRLLRPDVVAISRRERQDRESP